MIIFPAIDLYEKKAVRLYKGDYSNMTVYSDNPIEVAKKMESQGAAYIHMVDLEGAKNAATPNLDVVAEVAAKTGLFVEIGGGIRDIDTAKRYFLAGAKRVILGTAAVENEAFLKAAVKEYGEKIAVGADIKDGYVAIKGWTEKSSLTLFDFLGKMQEIGVKNIICTDISKDGALKGTNLEMYREIKERFSLDITASGGISDISDIEKLRGLDLYGAIVGKAYYTGAVDLKKAIEVAR